MELRDGTHRLFRRARGFVLAALLVGGVSGHAPAEDPPPPLAPMPLLDRIGRAAVDLAKRARRDDADTLIDVSTALRAPAANVAALKAAEAKALEKPKPAPLPMPDVAKTLAKIATDLAALLPPLEGDAKTAVAGAVLRIDATNRAAHLALGDVERGGAWLPASFVPMLARRGAIQNAIREARKFPVEVTTGVAEHPLIEKVHGKKGVSVKCGSLTFESATFGVERMTRQVRELVRATVLVNWMLTGEMKLPDRGGSFETLVFDRHEDYLRALDEGHASRIINDEGLRIGRQLWAHQEGRLRILCAVGESQIGSWGFLDALDEQAFDGRGMYYAPTPIVTGLVNWVCVNFLGCPMPRVTWVENPDKKKGGATSDTPQQIAEREAMLHFAKAGFAGLRMWMRWLARRHEDPAWSRSFVDEMGKIAGDDISKCTFVFDYLLESEELVKVVRGAWGGAAAAATYEKALGGSVAEFEQHWREWFLAGDAPVGLVQTLGVASVDPLSPVEKACLDHLDELRRRTLGKDAPALGIDRDLSDGCRAHALYLSKHPAQCAAWPDAHEEYPGEEGFSPEGGRAGLSSVIAPGVAGPEAAIDSWMATFYHRLPLVAPGLVRIGWGYEKNIAVLDSGSLVAPPEVMTWVAWPPVGGSGVPRRFSPELPNPVPGADQSTWGYPVTLQFFTCQIDPDVRMTLHVGASRSGAEVACFYSTPGKPTNTQLAPGGSFCLIPKQPLAANATYTVAVDGWPKDAHGADWTFTTGAK